MTDHAHGPDITQNDNTAARTGDKLKRRVPSSTGVPVGSGPPSAQPGQPGRHPGRGYAGTMTRPRSSVMASRPRTAPR